jgi:hypothetical protein
VFLHDLLKAIGTNKIGLLAHICTYCGAKAIGLKTPGNRMQIAYHPRYAVRMLKANFAAGIEAPTLLYGTGNADGSATMTYRKPTALFAPYKAPGLDAMVHE